MEGVELVPRPTCTTDRVTDERRDTSLRTFLGRNLGEIECRLERFEIAVFQATFSTINWRFGVINLGKLGNI